MFKQITPRAAVTLVFIASLLLIPTFTANAYQNSAQSQAHTAYSNVSCNIDPWSSNAYSYQDYSGYISGVNVRVNCNARVDRIVMSATGPCFLYATYYEYRSWVSSTNVTISDSCWTGNPPYNHTFSVQITYYWSDSSGYHSRSDFEWLSF